jgi:hypothetical protein
MERDTACVGVKEVSISDSITLLGKILSKQETQGKATSIFSDTGSPRWYRKRRDYPKKASCIQLRLRFIEVVGISETAWVDTMISLLCQALLLY